MGEQLYEIAYKVSDLKKLEERYIAGEGIRYGGVLRN